MNSKIKKAFLVSSAQMQYSRPPAGLAFLAGVCEKNNVEYQLCDLNIELMKCHGQDIWDQCYPYSNNNLDELPQNLSSVVDSFLDNIVKQIVNSKADCVAITVLTHVQQQWAEKFLQRLRAVSNITTIAGGPGIGVPYRFDDSSKLFGRRLVDLDLLNYYVLGEGDIIFDEFLRGNVDLLGINRKETLETWQPQIDDLNSISLPSYRKVNFDLYQSPEKSSIITIAGSRGCVRRCTFCDIGHLWKKFRFRSGKNVADEILKHHLETGVTTFWFSDSLLNGSLKQFVDMLEHLLIYKEQYPSLKDLSYSAQFIVRSANSHPERLFELMHKTGCNQLQIGVESGSERVRDHMGKKFSNADVDYHFKMCEKYQIKNWLLMTVGYPTETEEDVQDTLNMLTRYQKYIINDTMLGINLQSTLQIIPGAPLWFMKEELGIMHTSGKQEENWICSTNPELTIPERYLRWIRITRLALQLGYNLPVELPIDLISLRRTALGLHTA